MIYDATTDAITPLDLTLYKSVFLLTGAGISVASGLSTYRGPGGLWTTNDVARIADANNLPDTLPDLWRLYRGRREQALQAVPNAAHRAIAALQAYPQASEMNRLHQSAVPSFTVTLVTQNVDLLHQRAGSLDVLEMHGSAFRTRCWSRVCTSKPFYDANLYDEVPRCPVCGAELRPDVVLFNESIPSVVLQEILVGLSSCDLFIAVGTSGSVAPASEFVRGATYVGAKTINVNVEPSGNRAFSDEYIGPAEDILPALFGMEGYP